MNTIQFHDTHVYPGCRATVSFRISSNSPTVSALAEFSDGGVADVEVEQANLEELIVHIDKHTTAGNTNIPKKTWRLRYEQEEELWKVVGKL